MRIQIFIFIIFIFTFGCIKKVEKIYYPNGKINQIFTLKNGVKNGTFKKYYQSGQLEGKGFFKNDKKEGEFIWYYENGNIKTKSFYVNNSENGKVEIYYENGNLQIDGYFKDGEPDSNFNYYYPNGIIKKEVFYKNGKEFGEFKTYFQSGQLKIFAIVENDTTILYSQEFNELGKVIKEFHQININSIKDSNFVGEPFIAKIKISGPINEKKVKIIPILMGADKKSTCYENIQELEYSSKIIEKPGKYLFQVNVFIDTSIYNKYLLIDFYPR